MYDWEHLLVANLYAQIVHPIHALKKIKISNLLKNHFEHFFEHLEVRKGYDNVWV